MLCVIVYIVLSSFTPPCHKLIQPSLSLQLSPAEMDFLATHSSAALSEFEKVGPQSGAGEGVLAMAGSQIERAKK